MEGLVQRGEEGHGVLLALLVTEETGIMEWLQIDLGREQVVVGVITQGRYAGGQGQEFAEFVKILVWGGEGEGWQEVKEKKTGSLVIRANSDTHSKVEIIFEDSVITSKVRIVPVSKHPRMVCLRVELLGCQIQSRVQDYLCSSNIIHDINIFRGGRKSRG